MSKATPARSLLLDACAVINLAACGLLAELARENGSFHVVDLVLKEVLYVRRGGAGDEADEREPIELEDLITSALIRIESRFSEEELTAFVDLAFDVDDGEAMTLAVARHRKFTVVTDDRKAMRIVRQQLRIPLVTSLELIREWATQQALAHADCRRLLVNLQERGRYIPPRSHPLREWWESVVKVEK